MSDEFELFLPVFFPLFNSDLITCEASDGRVYMILFTSQEISELFLSSLGLDYRLCGGWTITTWSGLLAVLHQNRELTRVRLNPSRMDADTFSVSTESLIEYAKDRMKEE